MMSTSQENRVEKHTKTLVLVLKEQWSLSVLMGMWGWSVLFATRRQSLNISELGRFLWVQRLFDDD